MVYINVPLELERTIVAEICLRPCYTNLTSGFSPDFKLSQLLTMFPFIIIGFTVLVSTLAQNVPPNCDCSAIPAKRPMCGNDGHNYTDNCLYMNAKVSNPNLGWRPCFLLSDPEAVAQWMKSMPGPMDPAAMLAMATMERQACLTNGQNAVGTMRALNEQVQSLSADVGIRCLKPCPCPPDVCPVAKA